jgi:putative transcriptional regulator
MKEKTLGQELVSAVREALASKESGKVVRPKIDVAAIRKKLKLTQQQFSKQYHIKLETLRNWEQEKRYPDTTVLAYLTCIAKRPKLIKEMLNTDH